MSKLSVALSEPHPDWTPPIFDLADPNSLKERIVKVEQATRLLELAIGGVVLDYEHSIPGEPTMRLLHHLAGEVRVLADQLGDFYEEHQTRPPVVKGKEKTA